MLSTASRLNVNITGRVLHLKMKHNTYDVVQTSVVLSSFWRRVQVARAGKLRIRIAQAGECRDTTRPRRG